MSLKVIACAGQAESGKDTAGDYLAKKLNEIIVHEDDKWKRIAFANAVKKVFMDTFNVNREFVEEWKRKDEIPEGFDMPVRKSLQFIGDGFRKIKGNIWIETAFRTSDNIIISDGRYINEAKVISEKGGITVLVWRPRFENDDPNPSESQIRPFVDYCAKNLSDGPILGTDDLKYFDFFLKNDGSLEDLQKKIDQILIPFVIEKIKS
jgi:hypothetical protein